MKLSAEEKIIQGLQGFANALEKGQDVSKTFTCRKVVLNLEPTKYDPELVKKTRAMLGISQTLFAQFLGVSASTVRGWEQGARTPDPMACRFMDEIRCRPSYWQKRFLELAAPKSSAN